MLGKEQEEAHFSGNEELVFYFTKMLYDNYNRKIDYLRISVTDRCNLRCVYCMPSWGISHKPNSSILSFEEIHKIVEVAIGLGIEKVRLTGGEPLVRKGLPLLIERLKKIGGLKEICLTTNGIYLGEYAPSLKEAGLDRINISLDSLDFKKFESITRGGDLDAVLQGIDSCFSAGFHSLKINTVLLKGFNTDEIIDFALFTKGRPVHVRFIEYMPTNLENLAYDELFFSANEAKDICGSLGRLEPMDYAGPGTARVFRINNYLGTVGFISPISEPFCSSCNKLRLTSDGFLRSCLHSPRSINLKERIESGASNQDLAGLIQEAVLMKPESHNLQSAPVDLNSEKFSMCQIGG